MSVWKNTILQHTRADTTRVLFEVQDRRHGQRHQQKTLCMWKNTKIRLSFDPGDLRKKCRLSFFRMCINMKFQSLNVPN